MEKLQQAESEEAQRQILEQFAQDLPITNRTIKGGEQISWILGTLELIFGSACHTLTNGVIIFVP